MAPTDAAAQQVPQTVRVLLLHGYLQRVADRAGVDLLHVKGPALDPSLTGGAQRGSADADVLVRPAHVGRLVDELGALGWQRMTGFTEGSAFGHAMNLRHDLGMIDVHRHWPGFGLAPTDAFDRLWSARQSRQLAHVDCPVPSLEHQRLILLLHYARSGGQRPQDREAGWDGASADQRAAVRASAAEFDADLALAAAIGELEMFRDRPQYRLWRHFASGSTDRLDEWAGRWSAARTWRERVAVIKGFFEVNDDLLRLELGHEPGRGERLGAYRRRLAAATGSLLARMRGRVPGARR